MKIRSGFVSNSSSSSFIIPLYKISDEQKDMIYNHIEIGKKVDEKLEEKGEDCRYEWYEEWNVDEDDFAIWCSTSMDNFDLYGLMIEEIKINPSDIIYIGEGAWGGSIFEMDEYIKIKNDVLRSKKINKVSRNIKNEK